MNPYLKAGPQTDPAKPESGPESDPESDPEFVPEIDSQMGPAKPESGRDLGQKLGSGIDRGPGVTRYRSSWLYLLASHPPANSSPWVDLARSARSYHGLMVGLSRRRQGYALLKCGAYSSRPSSALHQYWLCCELLQQRRQRQALHLQSLCRGHHPEIGGLSRRK